MTTQAPPPPLPPPTTTGRYRRWRAAYDASRGVQILTGAIAIFVALVLMALLLSWPRFLDMPTTFLGWLWLAIILIFIVGLVFLAWRLLAHTGIGSVVVIVILVILLLPFAAGLIAGAVRGVKSDIGSLPPAPTATAPPVTVTPTVTAPTVTVPPTTQPTEPQASDEPAPTPTVVAPVPVNITMPGNNAPVTQIFSLSGNGDIPTGRQLVAFVYAKSKDGTMVYYTNEAALRLPGDKWAVGHVYAGSPDPTCDVGHPYKVVVVLADDKAAANLAGQYTPDTWKAKFGSFPSDSITVFRLGTPLPNC